jgi:hypothetical protein
MMNDNQKAAVLARLVDRLRSEGSWAGETHIQKAAFFLQELLGVPLGFNFILYKHGPFSFDLRDELSSMRADDILALEAQMPYGSRFKTTDGGRDIERRHPKTLSQYEERIDFVASTLGDSGVSDLERLATALYITLDLGNLPVSQRAARLHEIKPHVSLQDACNAVERVDLIRSQVPSMAKA